MDTVWRRARWTWPLFLLAARGRILFPETGVNVDAALTIRPGRDGGGLPQQLWHRTFTFGQRVRHFDSVLAYDGERLQAVERVGLWGVLSVPWRITLDGATTEVRSSAIYVQLGPRRVRIPRFLAGEVLVRETVEDLASRLRSAHHDEPDLRPGLRIRRYLRPGAAAAVG
jgi:hypothetical protein